MSNSQEIEKKSWKSDFRELGMILIVVGISLVLQDFFLKNSSISFLVQTDWIKIIFRFGILLLSFGIFGCGYFLMDYLRKEKDSD